MNKIIKLVMLSAFMLITGIAFGQVRIANNTDNSAAANSSAFIDASSNTTYNNSTNMGKGLLFPRVDLTTFAAFGGTPMGIPTSYPNYYDGFIVYNTATSGVAGVGETEGELSVGFWYYENTSGRINGGTWKPVGSGTCRCDETFSADCSSLPSSIQMATGVAFSNDYTLSYTGNTDPSGIEILGLPTGVTSQFISASDGEMTFRISGTTPDSNTSGTLTINIKDSNNQAIGSCSSMRYVVAATIVDCSIAINIGGSGSYREFTKGTNYSGVTVFFYYQGAAPDANDISVLNVPSGMIVTALGVYESSKRISFILSGTPSLDAEDDYEIGFSINGFEGLCAGHIHLINPSSIPVTSITVSGDDVVAVGSSIQLTANVLPANATNKNVIWTITNLTGSAVITSAGVLTGVSAGNVLAYATSEENGEILGYKVIEVQSTTTPVTAISISGSSSVNVGSSTTYTASITPSTATNKNVSWSISSGGSYATINSSTGLLTGTAAGTVTVRATAQDGSNVYATKSVTIVSPPPPTGYVTTIANGTYIPKKTVVAGAAPGGAILTGGIPSDMMSFINEYYTATNKPLYVYEYKSGTENQISLTDARSNCNSSQNKRIPNIAELATIRTTDSSYTVGREWANDITTDNRGCYFFTTRDATGIYDTHFMYIDDPELGRFNYRCVWSE